MIAFVFAETSNAENLEFDVDENEGRDVENFVEIFGPRVSFMRFSAREVG